MSSDYCHLTSVWYGRLQAVTQPLARMELLVLSPLNISYPHHTHILLSALSHVAKPLSGLDWLGQYIMKCWFILYRGLQSQLPSKEHATLRYNLKSYLQF